MPVSERTYYTSTTLVFLVIVNTHIQIFSDPVTVVLFSEKKLVSATFQTPRTFELRISVIVKSLLLVGLHEPAHTRHNGSSGYPNPRPGCRV